MDTPLLVCFYSGGNTGRQGRNQLAPFITAAASKGFEDTLVLDNYPEPPYDQCETWAEYVEALVRTLDADDARRSRKLVLFAFSLGCKAARGLARALPDRVLKVYLTGCRPCHVPIYEVWHTENRHDFNAQSEEVLMQRMVVAWPNAFLERAIQQPIEEWKPTVKTVESVVRKQYGGKVMGAVLGDPEMALDIEELKIAAPIWAFATEEEAPLGETLSKMQKWSDLTSASCEVRSTKGGHFDCLTPEFFNVILDDMCLLVNSQAEKNTLG